MDWQRVIQGTTKPETAQLFNTGDEIRVWYRILEQGKERLGQFEGLVIRCHGRGSAKTFTVRRVTHGEGVERIFPIDAKIISKIDVLRKGRVRRSRLYFLRRTIGKTRIGSASAEGSQRNAPATGKSAETQTAVPAEHVPVGAAKPVSGPQS